jgi:uncharacterized protein DUF5666
MSKMSIIAVASAAALLVAGCRAASSAPSGTAPSAAPPAAVATVSTSTPAAVIPTPSSNPVSRISGTVSTIAGNTVTTQDNKSFMIDSKTMVTRHDPASASAIQPGRVVAITAKRQPDDSLLATMILVFRTAPNFTLGQRPLEGGDLMTNAKVDSADAGGFTVSFPGGGAQVKLAPGADIEILAAGTSVDIKSGAMISAAVRDGVAQSVSIQ